VETEVICRVESGFGLEDLGRSLRESLKSLFALLSLGLLELKNIVHSKKQTRVSLSRGVLLYPVGTSALGHKGQRMTHRGRSLGCTETESNEFSNAQLQLDVVIRHDAGGIELYILLIPLSPSLLVESISNEFGTVGVRARFRIHVPLCRII